MTGYLIDVSGNEYILPPLLSWSVVHTLGLPCESFELCSIFSSDMARRLPTIAGFRGEYNNETVFRGVVDEYEIDISESGSVLRVSGRGMAALLLDNESAAIEYGACTLHDIIRNHVTPCEITDISSQSMPAIWGYTVPSGASHWKALYGFTHFAGGIMPRFSRDGKLVISSDTGPLKVISSESAVFDIKLRERRYGVISEMLVKNAVLGTSDTVRNEEFIARGGRCKRVITVPRKTGYDAMRYTGAFQIENSMKDSYVLCVTVEEVFAAFPNEIVELNFEHLGIQGRYKVSESESWQNEDGAGTRIKLIKP